jgi:acid phosphatase family membrane protein YuiD
MNLEILIQNHVLWTGMSGWFLAQVLKIPVDYFRERHWNWALFFAAGGMPSSGFDTPLFAVAVAFAMVVVYDATGVRRQAGMQAKKINILVEELLKGHPINEQHLREVIGHTPLEALGGVLLGLILAVGLWLWWG